MKTEHEIRESLDRVDTSLFMDTPSAGYLISARIVQDYLIAWVRRKVLGELENQAGFYCFPHNQFYLQPTALGETGLGCPRCQEFPDGKR